MMIRTRSRARIKSVALTLLGVAFIAVVSWRFIVAGLRLNKTIHVFTLPWEEYP